MDWINFLISLIEIFIICAVDLWTHAVQRGWGWKNCLWSHQKFLLSDTNLHGVECSAITSVARRLTAASCLSARKFSTFSLAFKLNFLRTKRHHEAGADKSSREDVRRRPNRKHATFIFHYYAAASRWIGRSKPVESSRRNSLSSPSPRLTSSIDKNTWAPESTKLLFRKVTKLDGVFDRRWRGGWSFTLSE